MLNSGMNNIAATIDQVVSDLSGVLDGEVRSEALRILSETDKMEILRAAGDAQRRLDALVVETIASVDSRPAGSGEPTFAARFGCGNVNELLQRVLRVDAAGAGRVVKAAKAVERDVSFTSGAPLPARWDALREALLDGVIGIPGLLAAIGPIDQAGRRVSEEDRVRADAELADLARGCAATDTHGGQAPPATPEDLRLLAQVIVAYLDPDGAEPAAERAMGQRFLTLGRARDGSIPIRGSLLPEVAAQLQRLFDAFNSPKVDGPPAPGGVVFHPSDEDTETAVDDESPEIRDPRSPGQKRHDAFAAILGIAARHDDVPTLGGAAPTLVVSVTAEDYAAGTGWAHVDGIDTPVPVSVAAQTACAGGVQRVLFDSTGKIVGIGTTDRIFNAYQRRAIVLRDKECLIPGCHVRATWCEFHHVHEHATGGPTHTDNGVPLCWFHHRTLDTSGWEIRMLDGRPQIRGPAWWDPQRQWRHPNPIRVLRH